MNTVIIFGPMASGKTRNAAKFMAHYGCTSLHDGYEQPHGNSAKARNPNFVEGGLYLTNHINSDRVPPHVKIICIEDALLAIGITLDEAIYNWRKLAQRRLADIPAPDQP